MIALLTGILALIYGDILLEKRRILWGLGVIIPILVIKSVLPGADIEEGHNIFLYLKEGEALQRALPTSVYNDWRSEFDKAYPPLKPPYEMFSWRFVASHGALPDQAYAWSSDALWRPSKYSRKVDTISFNNLAEFRGGFANELKYNWFRGTPDRRKMPFFVMYEFSGRSVGCKLYWKDAVFWERQNGDYEKIIHTDLTSRIILQSDVGKKVYFLFIPEKTPTFLIHLELNGTLAMSRIARHLLIVLAILCLFYFMISLRWKPFLKAIAIIAIATVFIYLSIALSGGKPLGALYTPHGGGDDGLFHESLGRQMAKNLFDGRIHKALEGNEPVYWFTPGMRYFRALEKIIFGDTNLGLTAFLACLPWLLFLFSQRLCGKKWALLGTFVFLFSPVSFSYAQYVFCGLLGYAESVNAGLFFIGFFLFLKSQPRWGGQVSSWSAFVGGACLAGAFFVRPNYVIAAVVIGAIFLYVSLRDRHFRILFPALSGLALAFWMPFHNIYFGHQFYLISKSGATVSTPLKPFTYLQALSEVIMGHSEGPHLLQAVHQIEGWLWTPPVPQFPFQVGITMLLTIRLLTLFVTFYALFISWKKAPNLALVAWIALVAHLPMLFVFATQLRYDLLGWDLSAVVTIMLAAHIFRYRSIPLPWKGKISAGKLGT